MSLFYAHATPMLKVLSDATSKFVSEVNYINWYIVEKVIYNEKYNIM